MTGMHVREPRPCAPPLRGKHSGYKGPTNIYQCNYLFRALRDIFHLNWNLTAGAEHFSFVQNEVF